MQSKSIAELGAAMQAGEFSSVELTRHFIDRVERLNGDLNALITSTPDQALAEAEAADRAIRSGQAGPLTGFLWCRRISFAPRG